MRDIISIKRDKLHKTNTRISSGSENLITRIKYDESCEIVLPVYTTAIVQDLPVVIQDLTGIVISAMTLIATPGLNYVELNGIYTDDPNLDEVRIYRGTVTGFIRDGSTLLTTISSPISDDPFIINDDGTLNLAAPTEGTEYFYIAEWDDLVPATSLSNEDSTTPGLEGFSGYLAQWNPDNAQESDLSPAESGDLVTRIDSTPSGFLASTSISPTYFTLAPAFGNRSIIAYNSSDHLLVNPLAPTLAAITEVTFYVVAKANSDHSGTLISAHGATGNTNRLILWFQIDADFGTGGNQPGIGLILDGGTNLMDQRVVCIQTDIAVYALKINLVTGDVRLLQNETVLINTNVGAFSWLGILGRVSFGQEYDTSAMTDFFNGNMGRIAIFDEAHSDSVMDEVVTMLRDYYGF